MLQVFKGGVVRAVSSTFIFGGAKLIIVYLIVLPFILSGNTLTPKSVITTLSLINVIRLVFVIFVVRCFFVVYEAYVAIVRIQVCTKHVRTYMVDLYNHQFSKLYRCFLI